MSRIRVFIADDHPVVVEGIERFAATRDDLEIVGTASASHEILSALSTGAPEVLSLDVQMPGMRGPETIAAIAEVGVPILLFTLHPIDDAIAALIHAGASGYLSKSSRLPAYLDALRAVRDGERVLPDALVERLEAPPPKAPAEVLTARELEVFERLARGDTIKEAAFHLGLSASTVYAHTQRVRRKLGVSTTAEMARSGASRSGMLAGVQRRTRLARGDVDRRPSGVTRNRDSWQNPAGPRRATLRHSSSKCLPYSSSSFLDSYADGSPGSVTHSCSG